MTAQVDPTDRLWTRELAAVEDVERLVRQVVARRIAIAAQHDGYDDDVMSLGADVYADGALDNHAHELHEAAVCIIERCREVQA